MQEQGIVKWFNNKLGYGFIIREGKPDALVHYKSILMEGYKTLSDGQPVTFKTINGPAGVQAIEVTPA